MALFYFKVIFPVGSKITDAFSIWRELGFSAAWVTALYTHGRVYCASKLMEKSRVFWIII